MPNNRFGAVIPARRYAHRVTLDLPPLQTIDVDGPMAYREWDGPSETTFVLLHGLGGSHLSWLQVAPGLAGLGRVLAPDLPGFGRSPRAGRGTDPDGRSALGLAVPRRDDGGPRRSSRATRWVGWWRSSEAAMEPERIAGIVLTSSVFPLAAWRLAASARAGVVRGVRRAEARRGGRRARRAAVDPDTFVRLGLRMLTVDPSTIPEDVIALNAELVADFRASPEATDRVPGGRALDQRLCAEPDAGAPSHEQRALPGARDPRPEGPVRAGRLRRGALAPTPPGGGVCSPVLATCRRWRLRLAGSPRSPTGTRLRCAEPVLASAPMVRRAVRCPDRRRRLARDPAPALGDRPYGATVRALDNVFAQQIVRIQPGQSVEWANDGQAAHTVTADDGSWDSGNLAPRADVRSNLRRSPASTPTTAATTGAPAPA